MPSAIGTSARPGITCDLDVSRDRRTHLLAMGASAGIIAFSDLRLLGWVMKKEPVSEVMGRLLPWAIGGFAVVMVTGILLFWADAESLYRNRWFRFLQSTPRAEPETSLRQTLAAAVPHTRKDATGVSYMAIENPRLRAG